jgi:predicted phage terminase large subunit-like protein
LKWSDEEIILPGHDGSQEPSVLAFGVDKQMPTGLHFPRIKLDDMVTPENTTSPDLIQNTIDNFGLIRSSILQQAGGNMQVCGTIYDDADCHRTLEDSGDYTTYKQAAESHPYDPELNAPLWPEQFPLETLAKIKRDPTVGTYIYSCQYLLDPAPEGDDAFFQLKWFPRYSTLPKDLDIYCGMDFAISEKKAAAFTAIMVVGVDKDNKVYILDVIRGHWDSLTIIENMFDVQLQWHPLVWVVEDDIIRKVLGAFLKLKMIERNIFLNLDPRRPVTDKISRARPLQGLAKEGMVVLPKKGPEQPKWLSLLEFALRRFPRGKIKDTIDAGAWVGQFLQDSAERWGRRQVFSMLNELHFGSPSYVELFPILCGVVPPGDHPFYAVWVQPTKKNGIQTINVLRELQIIDEPLDMIVRELRKFSKEIERLDVRYAADASVKERKGAVQESYFYRFSKERVHLLLSKTSEDVRLKTIREILLGHKDRKLLVNESSCPLLVRALKTAKWKYVNGIKTDQLEYDPMLYPLEAFQVAVESAVGEKRVVGY